MRAGKRERERERVEACIRRDDDVVALLDVAEKLCIFYLTENCLTPTRWRNILNTELHNIIFVQIF